MKAGVIRDLRRGVLGFIFLQSLFIPKMEYPKLDTLDTRERVFFYLFLITSVVLSPLMTRVILGLEFVFHPDKDWPVPTNDSNIFVSPLAFGHFASQLCLVFGVGTLVASIWCGWMVLLVGIASLLAGYGFFLGLLLCMRKYDARVIPPGGRPRLFDI